jgi:SSS family solute:Na+ symporter
MLMSETPFLTWFIGMLIGYIVIGTALAIFSRRYGVRTSAEYFAAGHRLGGLMASTTYAATTYSAFMMVGLVGLAYATGVGALGFELSYLIATLLLLTIFSRKVWRLGKEKGWVSASEMLSDLYGSKFIGLYAASLYLVALIPYVSAQFIGIGKIFEGLGVNYGLGVAVAALLVLLWVVIGGMWSKATTDLFQGAWMISAAVYFVLWLVLGYLPSKNITISQIASSLTRSGYSGLTPFWSISTFLAFTIPWWFFSVTNPQVVRKLFMPSNEKSLKSMIKYFGIYGLLYTLIVVFIGLTARGLTDLGTFPKVTDRDLVTPLLLLRLDPASASFVYVSIVAAAVTTANSIILSVTASFVRDVYENMVLKQVGSERPVKAANWIVALLTILIAIIAYLRPSFIVEMSVLSSLILLPLAPVTLAAWIYPDKMRGKATKILASVTTVVGTLIPLTLALLIGPKRTLTMTWCSLPLSAWLLIAATILLGAGYIIERMLTGRGSS